MDFLYKSRFDNPILSISQGEGLSISKASLENLKPLIPEKIDFSENVDLLGAAFNAAVINKFNKNDDGIDSEMAAKIVRNFLHKPANIEHDKKKIIGHIVSAGFSKYEDDDNSLISIEDALEMEDPFNLCLGAVLYKYADPDFAKLIMRASDPKDKLYDAIATSWEIGFNAFSIAIGSENLKDAEMVQDTKLIKELKPLLKAYGGSGKMKDGTRIYRLIMGDVYPLGVGFTTNPAADVSGVYTDPKSQGEVNINDKRDTKTIFNIKKPDFDKKTLASISQLDSDAVNNKKETTMDIEKILSEVKDLLIEKKFSEEAMASATNVFADAIKQKDAEYRESLVKAEEAKAAAEKEREDLKASVAALQTQLGEATTKITEFEAFKKQEEAIACFNARMEAIDSEYELEDEDRKVIADDLKVLDKAEEAFASFKEKFAVIWKHKSKEAIASAAKALQDKIDEAVAKKLETSKASVQGEKKTDEQVAAEALEKAQASDAGLPNNNENSSKGEPTLREKFASAFTRENIQIS